MADKKFTRTQEKQYTAWVTFPEIGTKIPGTPLVTDREKQWVLSAPDGLRLISAVDLSRDYLFRTAQGDEPINQQTASAKVTSGVIKWTQVVRNKATAVPVMARHIASKENNGLGFFEVYPDVYGQTPIKVAGHIFVRMFALVGGLKGIATPEQASAVTIKPKIEIAGTPKSSQPRVNKSVQSAKLQLPIPQGMSDTLGGILSKFYEDLKDKAKSTYQVDLTEGALYNSGYLGISFKAKGHKFILYTSTGEREFGFHSTDFKHEHLLGTDPQVATAKARDIFLRYLKTPRQVLSAGETNDLGSTDYSKFENCVTAELLSNGIILTIKDDVSAMDLLRFEGFTGEEKAFKYEGPFNTYGQHSMLVVYNTNKTWSYNWGNATTMTTKAVWDRNRVVVGAMEKLTGKIIYAK